MKKNEKISIIIIGILSVITIGFVVFNQIQNHKLQEKLLKENNQLKEQLKEQEQTTKEEIKTENTEALNKLENAIKKKEKNKKLTSSQKKQIKEINKKIEEIEIKINENDVDYRNEIDKMYTQINNISSKITELEKEVEDIKSANPPSFTISFDHAIYETEVIDIIVYAKNIPNYNKKNITWKIDNEEIAIVDKNGNVTGVKEGTTKITATYGKYTSTDTVIIKKATKYPEEIFFHNRDGKNDYRIGETGILRIVIKPEFVIHSGGTFSTSDASIVSINQKGEFTANALGTAIITFVSENNLTKTYTINVIEWVGLWRKSKCNYYIIN